MTIIYGITILLALFLLVACPVWAMLFRQIDEEKKEMRIHVSRKYPSDGGAQ